MAHMSERVTTSVEPSAHEKDLTRIWREALQRTSTAWRALVSLVQATPRVLIIPFVLFTILVVAGEVSVYFAAADFSEQRHQLAAGVVQGAAAEIGFLMGDIIGPSVALAESIYANPDVPSISRQFPVIAQRILSKLDTQGSVLRLLLAPWGVSTAVYPLTKGNLAVLNHKYFEDPARINITVAAFAQGPGGADVVGPVTTLSGDLGLLCRLSVFIPNATANATFGMDQTFTVPYAPSVVLGNITRPELTVCGSVCEPKVINGTTYSLWGTVHSVVTSQTLQNQHRQLETQGTEYAYVLFREVDGAMSSEELKAALVAAQATGRVVFQSESPVSQEDEPECEDIEVPAVNITWSLCIKPVTGWNPTWLVPLQIAIPFLAALISGLVFGMLVSQERLSILVGLMLPPKVIRYLNLGRTYAEPFQQVTILFSDIVSYTNMSSEMAPCQLVELLNSVYSHFDHLVDKHGLYKVETVGDAFMCVGGAPEACSPQDAAVRVARMALDIIDFAKSYVYKDGRNIEIRVGMYTGDVTAAVIGKKMPHWCLVGDAVNVASRMETNSIPMHVHLGHTTATLLTGHPDFDLQPRGKIHIKGKGPPELDQQDSQDSDWSFNSNAASLLRSHSMVRRGKSTPPRQYKSLSGALDDSGSIGVPPVGSSPELRAILDRPRNLTDPDAEEDGSEKSFV